MNRETFKTLAAIVPEVTFTTKKWMIDICMSWDENHKLDNVDEDQHFTAFAGGKWFYDEEITRAIARKADYLECSDGNGWTIWFGRYCTEAAFEQAFDEGFRWSLECDAEFGELTDEQLDTVAECGIELDFADRNREWNAKAEQEATEQEAQEAPKAHHTIYTDCTPAWTPTFSYDVSHARTEAEQSAIIERATATQSDAPASESVEDENWFCGDAPTDPDTANQDADTAALTRTAEDALYHQRAAEQAADKAKKRGPISFIISLLFIILFIGGAATVAHALTTTAGALNMPATATGETVMATRIDKKQTTTTTATATAPATAAPATATPTTPAPATQPPATATAPEQPTATPKAPTLAELLAKVAEAQKDAKTAPQTQEAPQATKETLSLKTALKRALMAPKTGTTECVIYSTLYAAIRIEEVTTPAPVTETPKDATEEEAPAESKSAWTISQDARRVAFMRELRNVAKGRAYCEQITSLLSAIDQSDDDYLWKVASFTSLDAQLQKAIKDQFEGKGCTDAEREECRTALDPHAERVTLHTAAIETAAEALARTAPEWSPLLFEEAPAPATLRQAILELQYCIFPIDSSPRARVFRGLEGIDFKTLSTPEDYKTACKAASLRAGEPSMAIPPEARARIIQWRSGSVASTSATVTSTAARLAAVWGMD